MKKTKHEFTCDLCERRKAIDETRQIPEGWLRLSIEDRHVDRMWTEKHICNICIEEIKSRTAKPINGADQ